MDFDLYDELTHSPKDPEGKKPELEPFDLYVQLHKLSRQVETFEERQRVNFVALSDTQKCLRQDADHNFHSIHGVWNAVNHVRRQMVYLAALNVAGFSLVAALIIGLHFFG